MTLPVLIANGLAQMVAFDDAFGFARRDGAAYVISTRQSLARWMFYNDALPANLRIEMTVSLVGGPTNTGFGLAFGRSSRDSRQWMMFDIAGDGHYREEDYGGTDAISWRWTTSRPTGTSPGTSRRR